MKTNYRPKTLWPFALLFVLSFVLHFAFLGNTNKIIFDEFHFANYAEYYLTSDYYFDIHPPLGKLMLAGFLKLAGENSDTANPPIFKLRFLPALFGTFFVLIISWLAFLITRSKNTALIAGFLTLFDNALLVQSRLALLDIFLLSFSALSLCFFFTFLKQKGPGKKQYAFLLLAGVFLGLAISIKWTGLATAGIIFTVLASKFFGNREKIKKTSISFAIILFFALTAYTLPFAAHFNILTNFDRQNFPMEQFSYGKEELQNSRNFFQKFETLNAQMLTANLGSADQNPDSSSWFKWPFNQKPLRYDVNTYFRGNTALWLLVAAFVVITLIKLALKKEFLGDKNIYLVLLLGYFANLLPFALIERTTFMYHYLPALTFGIILAAYWINLFREKAKSVFAIVFVIIIINFLVFLPHSLGLVL